MRLIWTPCGERWINCRSLNREGSAMKNRTLSYACEIQKKRWRSDCAKKTTSIMLIWTFLLIHSQYLIAHPSVWTHDTHLLRMLSNWFLMIAWGMTFPFPSRVLVQSIYDIYPPNPPQIATEFFSSEYIADRSPEHHIKNTVKCTLGKYA